MKTYQKGESVVFTVKVKNQEGNLVTNEIAKLTICNPLGTKVVEGETMQNVEGGNYEGVYPVPTDALTGIYVVIVEVGIKVKKTIARDSFRVVPTCA